MGKALIWIILIVVGLAAIGSHFSKPTRTTSLSRASAKPTTPSPTIIPTNLWGVALQKSAKDDSDGVFLTATSLDTDDDRFGRPYFATLTLRCWENTTAVVLELGSEFVADIESYGQVDYRIDEARARSISMRASTDNTALGLWSGGEAIPFIKGLFGAKRLWLRATPYNESPVEFTFQISELDVAATPLRKACSW